MIKNHKKTKLAFIAGATTLAALAPSAHAQSSDALIDKLVDKGILTVSEAKDLRNDADKDYKTAFQAKTGMPDWVTGYKIGGDIRGRYEQFTTPNPGLNSTTAPYTSGMDHIRLRYRLRFGITVNMEDNMEAGFRLGSGDPKGGNGGGNPLSNNSSFGQNFNQKPVYIDTAYGKWTPINAGGWMLSTTVGKMDNPFKFSPMVFDPDLTPEGGAIQGGYTINDRHAVSLTGGAFILNDAFSQVSTNNNSQTPFIYGGQATWKATWTPKWSSTLGVGAFELVNPVNLPAAGAGFPSYNNSAPFINQGNTRDVYGYLSYNYTPLIADASVTYTCDTFPMYAGAFPITFSGEYLNNPGAPTANNGYWFGITFGKAGTKRTWDLVYRYEYLEADAWYDQLVDDDNVAFYVNPPYNGQTSGNFGYVSGTNIKGHYIRFDYSVTDSMTLSLTCYVNSLINNPGGAEPQNNAMHFMADAMWKF